MFLAELTASILDLAVLKGRRFVELIMASIAPNDR